MSVLWEEQSNHWCGKFLGKHTHQVPPYYGRLPDHTQRKLDEFFKVNASESAHQMKLDNDRRSAISDIHSSLHNIHRVHYYKRKVAHKFVQKSSFVEILSFFTNLHNDLGTMGDFLKSNSINPRNAHLTIIDYEASKLIASN